MKASQKVITFLAQKVVHHRNQAGQIHLLLREDREDKKELLEARNAHDAVANTAELWITELRMKGL